MSTEPDRPTSHAADTKALDLVEAGRELLAQAGTARNGHASRLVIGGDHQRAVLMALTQGATLSEHESPPAATFQVLLGSARLYAVNGPEWLVGTGQLVAIPPDRHGVAAVEDCVILLTVALAPPEPTT